MIKLRNIPAFVIHVNGSSKRFDNIQNQINKKVFTNIQIFDAFTPQNLKEKNKVYFEKYYRRFNVSVGGHSSQYVLKNCCLTLSHLEILKMASEQKFENVIIFEDDFNIKFVDNFLSQDTVDSNFNILHIGGYYDKNFLKNKLTENIYEINSVSGTFGYVVSSRFYDTLIKLIETEYEPKMGLFAIDGFYSNKVYCNYPVRAFIPPLINTIVDFSELTGQKTDHYDYFKKYDEINS